MRRTSVTSRTARATVVLGLAAVIVLATCATAFAADNFGDATDLLAAARPLSVTLDGNVSANGASEVYYADLNSGDVLFAKGTGAEGFIFLAYDSGTADLKLDPYFLWDWSDWAFVDYEQMYYVAPSTQRYYFQIWAPPANVSLDTTASGSVSVDAGVLKKTSFLLDSADVASEVVPFNGEIWFGGDLFDSLSAPLSGQTISVTRQYPGGGPQKVGSVYTDADGFCEYNPWQGALRKATYTMHFESTLPDAGTGLGLAASSVQKTVIPKALLGVPVVSPTAPTHGRTFTTYGYLAPRHPLNGYGARLDFYRYESGKWKLRKTVTAKATSNTTYQGYQGSKYSASVNLPYAGKWKVRAVHSDADHYATYTATSLTSSTGWRAFTVK